MISPRSRRIPRSSREPPSCSKLPTIPVGLRAISRLPHSRRSGRPSWSYRPRPTFGLGASAAACLLGASTAYVGGAQCDGDGVETLPCRGVFARVGVTEHSETRLGAPVCLLLLLRLVLLRLPGFIRTGEALPADAPIRTARPRWRSVGSRRVSPCTFILTSSPATAGPDDLGCLARATPEQRAAIYDETLGLRITYDPDEPSSLLVEVRPTVLRCVSEGGLEPPRPCGHQPLKSDLAPGKGCAFRVPPAQSGTERHGSAPSAMSLFNADSTAVTPPASAASSAAHAHGARARPRRRRSRPSASRRGALPRAPRSARPRRPPRGPRRHAPAPTPSTAAGPGRRRRTVAGLELPEHEEMRRADAGTSRLPVPARACQEPGEHIRWVAFPRSHQPGGEGLLGLRQLRGLAGGGVLFEWVEHRLV